MRAHAMAKLQSKHRGSNRVSWALVVPLLFVGLLLTYLGSNSQLLGRLGLRPTAQMHTPTVLNGYKPGTVRSGPCKQLGAQAVFQFIAVLVSEPSLADRMEAVVKHAAILRQEITP